VCLHVATRSPHLPTLRSQNRKGTTQQGQQRRESFTSQLAYPQHCRYLISSLKRFFRFQRFPTGHSGGKTRSLRIDCTPEIAGPGIKLTADVANQITNPFQVVPPGGWSGSRCLTGVVIACLNLARIRASVRCIIHTESSGGIRPTAKQSVSHTLYLPKKCKTLSVFYFVSFSHPR